MSRKKQPLLKDIIANRPLMLAPVILRRYTEGGIKYYECQGGKIYVAEIYDKWFKVKPGKVLPKRRVVGGEVKFMH